VTAPFTDNGVTEKQYSDPQRVTLDTEIRLNLIGPTWLTGPGKVFVYAGANVLAPSDWAVDGHKSTLGIGGDVLLVALSVQRHADSSQYASFRIQRPEIAGFLARGQQLSVVTLLIDINTLN